MSENPPETPIPEETSQPTATPEPTEPVPIPPADPEPTPSAPVAPEASPEAESAVPVNNDNSASSPENDRIEQTAPADAEAVADRQTENPSVNKPISEAPTQPTAHSERNEPLLKSSISSVVGNTAKQERVKKKLENILELLNTKGKAFGIY